MMNQEIIEKLKAIATEKDEDGNEGPRFRVGKPNSITKLYFKGYVDGTTLYKIMQVVHIDGFMHRGGTTIMEIEELWEEDDF